MIDNIFLDPDWKIRGKSDDEIIADWERGQEESEQDDAAPDIIKPSDSDFLHVPAGAFDSISGYDEYSYLADDGLLVARKKLIVEGDVVDALELFTKDEFLANLTWYDAKAIVKNLDGLMLTPAMLWCVVDYLTAHDADPEMLEDLTVKDEEWLDGIIKAERDFFGLMQHAELYTTTVVDGNSWSPSWDKPVFFMEIARLDSGWFDLASIDIYNPMQPCTHSGLPYQFKETGSHLYSNPGLKGDFALARGVYRKGDIAKITAEGPNLWLKAYDRPQERMANRGVRLCRLVGDKPGDQLKLEKMIDEVKRKREEAEKHLIGLKRRYR